MESYIYWFVSALVLVGLEMVTGTFYLMVVAIGMSVGGFAAWLDASMTWQLSLCALTVLAGTFILRRWKNTQPVSNINAVNNLDVGQPVKVLKWNENGSARVVYRGAEWDAELAAAETTRDATLYIESVRGSCLVLTHQNLQK